jgi:hypothetical protein
MNSCARGKREKVALVAVMRRIIVILNAMLKSNTTLRLTLRRGWVGNN